MPYHIPPESVEDELSDSGAIFYTECHRLMPQVSLSQVLKL